MAYRQINNLTAIGKELTDLGYPADAVRMFNDVLGDTDRLQLARQMFGNRQDDPISSQARQGLETAVASVTPETLTETVRALLTPRAQPRTDLPALDLMIVVQPSEIDRATLTSLFETVVTTAAARAELLAELRGLLSKLDKAHPDDLSVQVVAALVDLAEAFPKGQRSDPPDPARQKKAEGSVNRLIERTRADAARRSSGGRSPQFQTAGRGRSPDPLVSRGSRCEHVESLHPAAEILADRAFEAANRQTDGLEALAILRERGQNALDRGDRRGAEQLWTLMLDRVLTGLTPRVANPSAKPLAPTITIDRFEQVAALSKLMASRGMTPLSLKAIRDALRGGPPVRPLTADQSMQAG